MGRKRKTIFFDTERQAEQHLKKNRKRLHIKGFKPTVQGNIIQLIPDRRFKAKPLTKQIKKIGVKKI
jgi:hypothetical protein